MALLATTLLVACTGGDDAAEPGSTTTTGVTSDPDVSTTATSTTPLATSATTTAPPTAPTSTPTSTAPPTTVDPASTPAPADTGVPGLDSDDAFCAAWSRFGGSWQVVLGASNFGSTDDTARLEVMASTVVADAYDAVFAAWPAELESERAVVADQFFGAFQRRSADAGAALASAGADEGDVAALAEVWVDALAGRDPSNPVLEVDVPADLAPVVDAAADGFAAQRPPFLQDPSMVIAAETPLTDAYLTTACPDQGSIFGSDV